MSHYRKVDTRVWNDAKFRALTNTGKLLFLFLVTHPGLTALGAMRGTVVGLSDELSTDDDLHEDWAGLIGSGMVEYDPEARFVALPNFLRYNRPESPNVIRSWVKGFDLLPECELRDKTLARAALCAGSCGEGFLKAFREAFPQASPQGSAQASPNQEQEQEQEQEHVGGTPPTTPGALAPEGEGGDEHAEDGEPEATIPAAPAPGQAARVPIDPTPAPTPAPSTAPALAPAPAEPTRKPAKPPRAAIAMADRNLVLPDWLREFASDFAAFEELRWAKHSKAPYTARAQQGIVAKLEKLREQGQDLGEVLGASVRNGWTDVYAQRGPARPASATTTRNAGVGAAIFGPRTPTRFAAAGLGLFRPNRNQPDAAVVVDADYSRESSA